jgi:hypothetical protein
MAKLSAKSAVILVNDSTGGEHNISSDCLTYDIQYANDTHEVTGFGNGSHNFITGQKVRGINLECLFNQASSSDCYWIFNGLYKSGATTTVTVTPESGQNMVGLFILTGMQLNGVASGDPIKIGSVQFQVSGTTAPEWTTT